MNDEQAALTIAQLVHRSSFKSTIAQSIHYLKGIQRLPTLFFNTNTGRKKKIPMIDITNPPIVPAANGNQNASLSVPTIKGIKPRMVETTVRKIGRIFALSFGISSQSRHSWMTPPDGIVFVEDIDTGVHRNTT